MDGEEVMEAVGMGEFPSILECLVFKANCLPDDIRSLKNTAILKETVSRCRTVCYYEMEIYPRIKARAYVKHDLGDMCVWDQVTTAKKL